MICWNIVQEFHALYLIVKDNANVIPEHIDVKQVIPEGDDDVQLIKEEHLNLDTLNENEDENISYPFEVDIKFDNADDQITAHPEESLSFINLYLMIFFTLLLFV